MIVPRDMLAFGSKMSWAEFADVWGRVLGKQCRHEYMDATELEKLVGEEMGKEFGDMFRYAEEFGYDGGDPSVVTAQGVSRPHFYDCSSED